MNKLYLQEAQGVDLDLQQRWSWFKGLKSKESYYKSKNRNFEKIESSSIIDKLYSIDEVYRLNEEFIINLQHELRTPLNMMLASIQLIESKNKSSEGQGIQCRHSKEIENIKINAFRLLKLSNNFLLMEELKANHCELMLSTFDIVSEVEALCDNINLYFREFIPLRNLIITFTSNRKELIVSIDREKIERVLLNLISNAVKFSYNNSKIDVKVYLEDGVINLSVKDYGIGIEYSEIKYIFQETEYAENRMTKNAEGCKLGLKISKELAELHNGIIQCRANEGAGTEFIVKIPVVLYKNNSLSKKADKLLYNRMDRIKLEFSDIQNN
ncbi:MAG: HAMP domain-containing sensor histidine kinase [Clostridium sp.]|nr:HAMP domain-containing sensor histidine kinase [Clostridium sp.]MDU7084354.1 HAMP domain-containing sensor histidine kinase [Clostridium sp.]